MKTIACLLLATLLHCLTHELNCYKFSDSDLIPARFLRRVNNPDPYQQLGEDNDLVLSAANRQKSLYPEAEASLAAGVHYQRALSAIAAEQALLAAAAHRNSNLDESEDEQQPQPRYSEELHLDDFIQDDDEDEDDVEETESAEFKATDPRDEETESHSSLIAGHQYVSGGAGEGKQHLHPDGAVDNKEEVKTDEDLPAYCDPPNPCPVGYLGEDCDARPFEEFTAAYSKTYQEQQNCMCDDDHNVCQPTSPSGAAKGKPSEKMSDVLGSMQMTDVDVN
jgi:hypothetical protein